MACVHTGVMESALLFISASSVRALRSPRPPCFRPVCVQVQAVVAAVLGGAEVTASTPLMTAGLDSLGAVELRKELSLCVRRFLRVYLWVGGDGGCYAACHAANLLTARRAQLTSPTATLPPIHPLLQHV